MLLLYGVNLNDTFKEVLQRDFELVNESKSNVPVFINWLGESCKYPEKLLKQIKILEDAIAQKRKIWLFDGDLALNEKHALYLTEKGVILTEPVIITRKYFSWCPFPIITRDNPELREIEKPFDLYLKDNATEIEKKEVEKIIYDHPSISVTNDYKMAKLCLVVPTERESMIGYLGPIDHLLKSYCIPFLFNNVHKYYLSLFWDARSMGFGNEAVSLKIKAYHLTDWADLRAFYITINTIWPEMKAEIFNQKIREVLYGKGNVA